jgi:hypothetical protein
MSFLRHLLLCFFVFSAATIISFVLVQDAMATIQEIAPLTQNILTTP